MGPGNKATQRGRRGWSGGPTVSRAATPILMVLKQEGAEKDRDLTDAKSVKLWIVNHIDDFCINVFGQNVDWKHKATDHEGLLVERKRNRPWAIVTDPDKEKYQVYFSTIPLIPPVDTVCNALGSQAKGQLSVTGQEDIPRPYPEDPFFLSISQKDLPHNFSVELKKISPDGKVSYDVGKSRLRSEPKMPDDVRDKLSKLKGANRHFRKTVEILHRESHKEKFPKIWLLDIPSSVFPQVMTSKKLRYWEAVMYRDSTSPHLDKYRDLMNRRSFTDQDLANLQNLLKDMRGEYVFYYLPDRKPPMPPPDKLTLPWIVYDRRSTPTVIYQMPGRIPIKSLCNMQEPGIKEGPFWAISIWTTSDEAAIPIEGDPTTKEPVIKGGVALFKMNPKYRLPVHNKKFLQVDDPLLDEIAAQTGIYLEELYKGLNEEDLRLFIRSVLNKKLKPQDSEFLSCFFYIGEAAEAYGAMMMALDGALRHMQCRSETMMTDTSSFGADPVMKIEKNVIVGFGTGCDGYSESPNPKHVYAQLMEWYEGLEDVEKAEVKDSYEIEVRGYTSPYGESGQVYEELRKNRAWKIAQSLKLILEKEKMKIELKENKQAPRTPPPDPSKKPSSVPLYFMGEPRLIYPTRDLRDLYSPLGSTLCDVIEDSPVAQISVKGVPIDNDPKDRIGWIILRRSELRKNTQFVKEKGKYNAAGPLAGYRMLGHAVVKQGSENIVRVLLYVIPASWT